MEIRNICIIAHVDHGKTTLVDFLLRQAGTFAKHEQLSERVMDSMDLERERGITILAKNTSVVVGDTKINIVDTPGHADFGGEVERIMGMVDGAVLLVDAAEGPLPQTRFVLQKAIKSGHKFILVINKVDRPECKDQTRFQDVLNQVFDLCIELGASEDQADFPVIYACGRQGWCTSDRSEIPHLISGEKTGDLKPLFDLILKVIPRPVVDTDAAENPEKARLQVLNLAYSDYVGRLAVGKVFGGVFKKSQKLWCLKQNKVTPFQITALYTYEGLRQTEIGQVEAGDIAVIAGLEEVEIGDTLAGAETLSPLKRVEVEKPTMAMIFSVNTSPMSGKEGEAIQSRKLMDRLMKEVRNNVALKFEPTEVPDQFRVLGRGELQFAILIEQMRREGFEFMIGKPVVLMQQDDEGKKEPIELAVLDLPAHASGEVTQLFQARKGILMSFDSSGSRVRLEIEIPTRGLLGLRSRYLSVTRGEGLFSTRFLGYKLYKGDIIHRINGSLVSDRAGKAVEYGMLGLEDRGVLFIEPGTEVYEGMIIGEHNKDQDLNVNACREKKLTNIRAAHAEVLVTLAGIRKMSLESCLEWIDEDEWIEVTPKSIRLRKKVLAQNMRSVKRF